MDKKNYLTILSLFIILLSSCNKDDTVIPTVTITSPNVGKTYDLPNTITVKANISDDQNIKHVQIKILDQDFNSVAESSVIDVYQTELDLSQGIYVDDPKIETGTYYIKVIAHDGFNETSAFREIYINGIPNERKGAFVVIDNGGQHNLMRLDSALQATTFVDNANDYSDIAISNSDQVVVWSGYIQDNAKAYKVDDLSLLWEEVRVENPPHPSFTSLGINEEGHFLLGKNNSTIQRKYALGDNNGSMVISDPNWVATDLNGNENYTIALLSDLSSNDQRVDVYWNSSLQRYTTSFLNFEATNAFAIRGTGETFFVFGNDNGNAHIVEWTNNLGISPIFNSLPTGQLLDVKRKRYNEFYLVYADKIVQVDVVGRTQTTLINYSDINTVDFDPANNQIIVGHTSGISIFSESGNLIATQAIGNVVDIECWMLR